MQHDAGVADAGVTAVVVVAPGALRRAAWEALLVGQAGLTVVETVSARAGRVAVLVDGAGVDHAGAEAVMAEVAGAGVLWLLDELAVPAVVGLLRAGAIGFLRIDASTGELIRALVAVGRGEIVLPAPLTADALGALARPPAVDLQATDTLTQREREVVGFLVEGHTDKEIAQAMFLSVRTVQAHLRSIYLKIDVRSRTEAVLWAIAHHREVSR